MMRPVAAVALCLAAAAAAGVPAGCQQQLDAWCAQNCPIRCSGGVFVALNSTAAATHQVLWRCYAPGDLNTQHTVRR